MDPYEVVGVAVAVVIGSCVTATVVCWWARVMWVTADAARQARKSMNRAAWLGSRVRTGGKK